MAKTVAVTGKGGTGKTFVSALLIKCLKDRGNTPILALDADPDANLATVLGISVEKSIGDLREETLKEIKKLPAGISKAAYIEAGLHEIIAESEGIDLIAMGRSEGPGCYCYVNSLLRKFAQDLESSYKWVVMDNEAGMEHLSRRTTSNIDNLIVVVNANPLSLDCAARVIAVLDDVKNDVGAKYALLNQVPDDKTDHVRQKIENMGLTYLGRLPYDESADKCIFEQTSLLDLDSTPAIMEIQRIINELED